MNAIEKINAEMQKNADDLYTEIIGTYVIDRCADPAAEAKVAAEGKTLKGAMDAVMKKARSAQKGSVAVLTPEAVFGEVDAYFGLAGDVRAREKALLLAGGGPAAAAPSGVPLPSFSDFL